jgi:hypothetical protein
MSVPKTAPLAFLLLAICLLFAPPAFAETRQTDEVEEGSSSENKPGITVVVDIVGKAELFETADSHGHNLQKGAKIPVGATLVTGVGGRVDLALSNGALFQIQENSQFTIGEFSQNAYEMVFSNGAVITPKELKEFGADEAVLQTMDASEDAWNKLDNEPTASIGKFNLAYGTMIGEAKKMKPGSRMEIITPIGVAGIRGTIWRLTITPVPGTGGTQFRGSLDVARGLVSFGNSEGTRAVNVAAGFVMSIDASVPRPGEVRVNSIFTNQMSPERLQLLQNTITLVASEQTYFTAVQGTPEILTGRTPTTPTTPADSASETNRPQVDLPSPVRNPIFNDGGTGGVVPRPTPTPPPSPTPTPTPAPTPKPSNG